MFLDQRSHEHSCVATTAAAKLLNPGRQAGKPPKTMNPNLGRCSCVPKNFALFLVMDRLDTTPTALVSLIFSFLSLRDHTALERCAPFLSRVGVLPSSSPWSITVPASTEPPFPPRMATMRPHHLKCEATPKRLDAIATMPWLRWIAVFLSRWMECVPNLTTSHF